MNRFNPDITVMASNTPSLMLQTPSQKVIDVKPPLQLATKISKSKHIGILGTKSAIKSRGLTEFIKKTKMSKSVKITKINGSDLVDLVESGKFITNEKHSKKIIQKTLSKILSEKPIDVITLSSTHLPFLKSSLEDFFLIFNSLIQEKLSHKKFTKKLRQHNQRQIH